MKRIYSALVVLCVLLNAGILYSQSPEAFKYQAIIRSNSGIALANQKVGIYENIHQSTTTGTIVYSESQLPTTSSLGLVNLNIGGGTVTSGNFSAIDWSN